MRIKWGDVFWVKNSGGEGSEQQKGRPAMVIQNDVGNRFSTTVIVAYFSSQINKAKLQTHVLVYREESKLDHDSFLMLEQVATIDKGRLKEKAGTISRKETIDAIKEAIFVSFSLKETNKPLIDKALEFKEKLELDFMCAEMMSKKFSQMGQKLLAEESYFEMEQYKGSLERLCKDFGLTSKLLTEGERDYGTKGRICL